MFCPNVFDEFIDIYKSERKKIIWQDFFLIQKSKIISLPISSILKSDKSFSPICLISGSSFYSKLNVKTKF